MKEILTESGSSRGRQLVLCFDGTDNNLTGGRTDTNVVKLCKLLTPSPTEQLLYYDPGVGNPGSIPGVTFTDMVRGKLERVWGLALGKGIYENIEEAYIFLMRNWRAEDRIFVFGFSRGAFTARSVAGMVARFGILLPSMEGLVPTLIHLYFADAGKTEESQRQYSNIIKQLGDSFCSSPGATADIWFVGVWDTVESVGSPVSRRRIPASGSIIGKRFRHVRQALALDEHRRSFAPRPYYIHPTHDYEAGGQSIDQQWWTGAHCDIGGGYSEEDSELSDHCFLWMLQQAVSAGLLVRPSLVAPGGGIDRAAAALAIRTTAAPRQALAHSETFLQAYWALTGLCVRNVNSSNGAKGDPSAKPPAQHPSPSGKPLRMPQDTIWNRRQKTRIEIAIVAGLVFWLLHAAAISGSSLRELMTARGAWKGLWEGFTQLAGANLTFAKWQLVWLRDGPWATHALDLAMPHPIIAVLMDVGFILSYGYLLSLGLARGFAHIARLRNVDQPPPYLLNFLGRSGTVIVLADLVKDLLMLGSWGADGLHWIGISDLLALAMSAAAAVKWLAIPPALVLIAGSVKWRRQVDDGMAGRPA